MSVMRDGTVRTPYTQSVQVCQTYLFSLRPKLSDLRLCSFLQLREARLLLESLLLQSIVFVAQRLQLSIGSFLHMYNDAVKVVEVSFCMRLRTPTHGCAQTSRDRTFACSVICCSIDIRCTSACIAPKRSLNCSSTVRCSAESIAPPDHGTATTPQDEPNELVTVMITRTVKIRVTCILKPVTW